jgi:hypothetical protein
MSRFFFSLFLIIVLLASSCSTIRQIRPLDPGQFAANLTVGGPITNVAGVYIPLPILALGYNYGLVKNIDLEAGFGITQAIFKIMHIDAGINWRPFMPSGWIPGAIATPKLHFMTNFKPSSFRLYPDLALTGWWQPSKHFLPYLGIENWFIFASERPDGNPQPHHWLLAPYAGITACNGPWQFQLEARVYSPNINHILAGAPENIGLGDYGVLGVIIGVGYEFGVKK